MSRRRERNIIFGSCGGDNAYETTLEEAISEGKTPCKKCAQ